MSLLSSHSTQKSMLPSFAMHGLRSDFSSDITSLPPRFPNVSRFQSHQPRLIMAAGRCNHHIL
jgi:hypothetical protein